MLPHAIAQWLLGEPIEFNTLVREIASTYDKPGEELVAVLRAVIDSLRER